MGDVYVDSSFLLKLYLSELESPQVDAAIHNTCGRVLVTALTDVEVISSLQRRLSVQDGRIAVQTYLANRSYGLFAERSLDGDVLELAKQLAQQHAKAFKLKSLDILHLATAVRHSVPAVATFDADMRAAAQALGLAVLPA